MAVAITVAISVTWTSSGESWRLVGVDVALLLRRLGRQREAAAAYERAAAIAPTQAERDFLSLGGRASREATQVRPT